MVNQDIAELQLHDAEGRPLCGREMINATVPFCRQLAGAGTTHQGSGPCYQHQPDLVSSTNTKYGSVVSHGRLKEILIQQEAVENVNNIDGEIILVRSMIMLSAENFGLLIKDDEDGTIELSSMPDLAWQRREIQSSVSLLSTLIKRKYETAQIAGQIISREAIVQYMNRVQLVLDGILKNQCPSCNAEHGLRDKVIDELEKIPAL